ncbi:MAG: hypothetical protein AAB838_01960 [Patescibacteria group bacterium]
MRKGNILLVILIVVGVVAVSVGGYFYLWPKFRYSAQDIRCVDDNQCPPEYYCYKNPENKGMFYLGGPGKCVKGQRQLQVATPLDNPATNWKTCQNQKPELAKVSGKVLIYTIDEKEMTVQFVAQGKTANIKEMLVWTDPKSNPQWIPFQTLIKLPINDFVYACFKDEIGNVSPVYSDSSFPQHSPANPIP